MSVRGTVVSYFEGDGWVFGTEAVTNPDDPYGEPLPRQVQEPCRYCQGAGKMS